MQTIELNTGNRMPIVGYGTYQITDAHECERSVYKAIELGYRLIDTAQAYGNEKPVGVGVRRAIDDGLVTRDELFITTKVWFRNFETDATHSSMAESMRALGLEYVDLVLLHWPFGNTYAAYRELEKLQGGGVVRSIGVSNYAPSQLIDLIEFNETVPAVNQIETSLIAQQEELHTLMAEHGITHQAYAPFGQGMANEMFDDAAVVGVAQTRGRTPRQVALRYMVQRGIAVIPKSVNPARMAENLDIFGFELTPAEMETLRGMDRNAPLIGNPQDAAKAAAAMTW